MAFDGYMHAGMYMHSALQHMLNWCLGVMFWLPLASSISDCGADVGV